MNNLSFNIYMINIHQDLILNIQSFLDVKDICNLSLLNKRFRRIHNSYEKYITEIMIKNSRLSYYEFTNDNCFRYNHNGNSHVFSFCKKNKIFNSKKEAFIVARRLIMNKISK